MAEILIAQENSQLPFPAFGINFFITLGWVALSWVSVESDFRSEGLNNKFSIVLYV